MGEKSSKEKRKWKKKISIWLLSHPPFYNIEADRIPVSENAKNKPDLL